MLFSLTKSPTLVRPVICVCYLNKIVGVVLKKDLDTASRVHWAVELSRWQKATRENNISQLASFISPPPFRPVIKPLFVFSHASNAFCALKNMCFVEEATFNVQFRGHVDLWSPEEVNVEEFLKAYEHFFGQKFVSDPDAPKAGGMEI